MSFNVNTKNKPLRLNKIRELLPDKIKKMMKTNGRSNSIATDSSISMTLTDSVHNASNRSSRKSFLKVFIMFLLHNLLRVNNNHL